MPGRAKGERFVIRGKERLDVGLHEDEFLLQAVFYCMGAGPNPDCRAPMLAPLRRKSLIPPPDHANSPAQILSSGRPCWRCPAGKTLSHRRATPTGRPESCLPAVHVGAAPPSKPYHTVGQRQQSGPNPACRPPMLAPPRRQNPIPPSGNANRPARIPPAGRPCWRRPAGKTLSHRRATPTVRPESHLPAVHVGAAPPSKPYPTAGPRQQSGPSPACRPPMLAPLRRQSLIPSPDHANRPARIPPAGRPCWRPPPAKPYSTVGPRQQSGPNPACLPSVLAPPRRQNLISPSGHANRPSQIPPAGRPCWRGQAPPRLLFIRKFINQSFSFTS